MDKLVISSSKIIITDPIYGCHSEGFCQNVFENVENGVWLSSSNNYLIVINEKYNESELKWHDAKWPCGVDSGLIGVYDYSKYAEHMKSAINENENWDEKKIDWGHTINTCADGFYEIQIGYNNEGNISGIREGPVIGYFCNQCRNDIKNVRYRCQSCVDYDLCQTCYEKYGHNQTHTLDSVPIDDLNPKDESDLEDESDPKNNLNPKDNFESEDDSDSEDEFDPKYNFDPEDQFESENDSGSEDDS